MQPDFQTLCSEVSEAVSVTLEKVKDFPEIESSSKIFMSMMLQNNGGKLRGCRSKFIAESHLTKTIYDNIRRGKTMEVAEKLLIICIGWASSYTEALAFLTVSGYSVISERPEMIAAYGVLSLLKDEAFLKKGRDERLGDAQAVYLSYSGRKSEKVDWLR